MDVLDNPELRQRLDKEDMLGHIYDLPSQIEDAWRMAGSIDLPEGYRQVNSVVVLGMGGSAIAGDLVRTLTAAEMPVPMAVVRDYDALACIGPETLVIASSYSGNTEETISAFSQSQAKGAKLLAICTGGKLKDLAHQFKVPLLEFHYQAQPRAALGYSAILLLGLCCRLGLVSDKSRDIQEAVSVLAAQREQLRAEVPVNANPAKALAHAIRGRLPFVYGAGILSEVARRWKGQFNENSKAWASFDHLPELNHNAVVGYQNPIDLKQRLLVIFLQSSFDHPRVQIRQTVTQELLAQAGVSVEVVQARGQSPLAQQMSTVYYGDFASYYLALLYNTDPTAIAAIDYLKQQLALSEQV